MSEAQEEKHQERRGEMVFRMEQIKEVLTAASLDPELWMLDIHGISFKLGMRFQQTQGAIEKLFLKWPDVQRVGIQRMGDVQVLYVYFVCCEGDHP